MYLFSFFPGPNRTLQSPPLKVRVWRRQCTLPVGVAGVLLTLALMIMSGMGCGSPQSHMRHADNTVIKVFGSLTVFTLYA